MSKLDQSVMREDKLIHDLNLPSTGTMWLHEKTGNQYRVVKYNNLFTTVPDKYPIMIVHKVSTGVGLLVTGVDQ